MHQPVTFAQLGDPPKVWPGDAALTDFPLREQLLVVNSQQTWSSAGDFARRLETPVSDIHKMCHELEEAELMSGRDMSITRREQRRYLPTRAGVKHLTKEFQCEGLLRAALPLTWQMTEEGGTRIRKWLPMLESLYEILPTFWTSGLAAPFQWQSSFPDPSCSDYVWLGQPTLVDVVWFPSGRLHVAATWRFDRDNQRPQNVSLPFLWSGLLPQGGYESRSLRLDSRYIHSRRRPGDRVNWHIEPPVVAIGMDEFAAYRARTVHGSDVQVGSVDTAGTLVWSAEASHSEWTLEDQRPQGRSIGHPEAAAIGEGPDLLQLRGIREYRIFCFVAEFRAATKANLVTAFHMSGGSVAAALNHLEERGLVTSVGQHHYLTPRGVDMLADLHRVNKDRLVEVTYLDPAGPDAIRERTHDSAVAGAAAKSMGAGIPVAAGWRWVVSWHNGQLVPDLWVRLPVPGREWAIWVPVEVEFSAKGKRRIETKLA